MTKPNLFKQVNAWKGVKIKDMSLAARIAESAFPSKKKGFIRWTSLPFGDTRIQFHTDGNNVSMGREQLVEKLTTSVFRVRLEEREIEDENGKSKIQSQLFLQDLSENAESYYVLMVQDGHYYIELEGGEQ